MKEFNLDGIDLSSDGAAAEIISRHAENVTGLKNKNAELITRDSDSKTNLETYKVEAEREKHEAAKALAEKNGNIEDYKIALQNEKDAMINLEATFQQEKEGRILGDALNEFSSALADDPAGKMYMQSLFNNSVEVKDGVVVSKDATKTMEDLKQSLVSDKANAKYIRADVGSGTGSAGSKGGDGSANTYKGKSMKDMSMAEKVDYLESKNT